MSTNTKKNQENLGFADVGKIETKNVLEYKLSCYACYLIVTLLDRITELYIAEKNKVKAED